MDEEDWRTCLNNLKSVKEIRERNEKDSKSKTCTDCKNLLAIRDNSLYVWDNYSSHLVYINLQSAKSKPKLDLEQSQKTEKRESQILLCTDPPRFRVQFLLFNDTGTLVALWGRNGISVLELPKRWGKHADYEGGKPVVTCRTTAVADHYFVSHRSVRLQEVMWHPGSDTDSHLVLLTSDNALSVYSMSDVDTPYQMIKVDDSSSEILTCNTSRSKVDLPTALGESVASFDFGEPFEISQKAKMLKPSGNVVYKVWPAYVVKGNGDVYIVYTYISSKRILKVPVQGPLLMHPPAEDNYGVDACSIACIGSNPNMLVISTCEGKLHHCMVLPAKEDDDVSESENTSMFEQPEDVALYVYETVELELTLAPKSPSESTEDDIFFPIRICKDPINADRYHCCHAAGIHTVLLPWLEHYQSFCVDDSVQPEELHEQEECIVEHLVCTKPLPSSAPSPVLGVGVVKDMAQGPVLLALTNDFEFITLTMSAIYKPLAKPLPVSPSKDIQSPLRGLAREPFYQYIAKILRRNCSNPLLKSKKKSEMSSQESFQIISRTTQLLREEYLQKQDLARQEIQKRERLLAELKVQHLSDLEDLENSKEKLREHAQEIAIKFDDCQDRQEMIVKRIETVLRKMQSRLPVLSDAERGMKRELEAMDEQLDLYRRNLEQISSKKAYQERQMKDKKAQMSSPALRNNQVHQVKSVLKREGDDLVELMSHLNQMKLEVDL